MSEFPALHHPPKMKSLPKIIFNSFLLLNGQCGIQVRPPASSDDFCLPFYMYPSSMVACYSYTSRKRISCSSQTSTAAGQRCRSGSPWNLYSTVNTSLQAQINHTAHSTVKKIDKKKKKKLVNAVIKKKHEIKSGIHSSNSRKTMAIHDMKIRNRKQMMLMKTLLLRIQDC